MRHGGAFPTAPYWHRDCPECPFREYCEEQLEKLDDVSLVRFTSFSISSCCCANMALTRERSSLVSIPCEHAGPAAPCSTPLSHTGPKRCSAHAIDKLDDLIYRARAFERGSSLRVVDASAVGCPTADVEVDVDMESYDDATYLWGASVTVNQTTPGVEAGLLRIR